MSQSWRSPAEPSSVICDQRLFDPLHDQRLEVLLEQHPVAVAINHVALAIQHVVVLDHVLADIEVVRFDFLLGVFDRPADPRVLERNVFFEAEACPSNRRSTRRRIAASVRLRARRRTATTRDRPGARRGRAAGCRSAAPRGARCPARAARRAVAPGPRPGRTVGWPARRAHRAARGVASRRDAFLRRGTPRPGRQGCRPARCRRHDLPCWSQWSPRRAGPPAQ